MPSVLRRLAIAGVMAVTPLLAASCGGDDGAFVTLPPMRTTTTTSTTSTTISDERIFYTIKRGESLSIIAESFGVPLPALIELNEITNPNNVYAGLTIEIPSGMRLVDELPTPPSSSEP